MPRKTASSSARRRGRWCFNEAAARCRGKPLYRVQRHRPDQASMRPRPDAAENAPPAGRAWWCGSASMRPRPDAAENLRCILEELIGINRLQ